jgi:hypothetical protein
MKRKKTKFSKPFNEALIKMEMIREMAIEDGWADLEECLKEAPKSLDIFLRHADAALRALERIQGKEKRV